MKRRLALDSASTKKIKLDAFFSTKNEQLSKAAFQWLEPLNGSCLHGLNCKPVSRSKLAVFDLDGTLIKANHGQVQWSWWRDLVPDRLKQVYDEGFSIIIVSNQAYAKAKVADWKTHKIPSIAAALPNVPFRIFGATEKDQFRKPLPGIWTAVEGIFAEEGVTIDKTLSFFVGDAAARPQDFSGTDRKWAANIGLPFYTPEEYFLGAPTAPFTLKGFHVSQLGQTTRLFEPSSTPLLPATPTQELVILLSGLRCAGKTAFFRRYLQPAGYIHVDQGISGARCLQILQDAFKEQKSCALELNVSPTTRKKYISAATQLGIPVRCFYFSVPRSLAMHNNIYRSYNLPASLASIEGKHSFLIDISTVEEPTLDEGFHEIKKIHWIFEGTEEERRCWSMWHTFASQER